jgi:hypothetical protein
MTRSGKMRKSVLLAGVTLLLGLAAGANSAVIATYNPVDTNSNLTMSGTVLSATNVPVTFNFLPTALAALGNLSATLNLSANEVSSGTVPFDFATFDGSFFLTYSGPTKTVGNFTVNPKDVLLQGSFMNAAFTGGGGVGSLLGSSTAPGSTVNFVNNSFLTFTGAGDEDVSIGMAGINPAVAVVAGGLAPFGANSQGIFSADGSAVTSGNVTTPITGVPEPASWALMLTGILSIGIGLRYSRRDEATA